MAGARYICPDCLASTYILLKVLCHHGCSELTMSSFNFHLHCLKCLTKKNILDDSLFSPFLYEMYVNLGKKLPTFLENSVGSGDEQMVTQKSNSER